MNNKLNHSISFQAKGESIEDVDNCCDEEDYYCECSDEISENNTENQTGSITSNEREITLHETTPLMPSNSSNSVTEPNQRQALELSNSSVNVTSPNENKIME